MINELISETLREHRRVFIFSAVYILIGGTILVAFKRPWPIRAGNIWFLLAWTLASGFGLALEKYRDRGRGGPNAMPRQRLIGALVLVFLIVPVQLTFQSLKQSIGPLIGFPYDQILSTIDVALHAGRPAWTWGAAIVANRGALATLDILYLLWFPGVFAFVVWLSWARDRRLRERALLAFLAVWAVGGTICAALLASAGPVYQPQYSALANQLSWTIAAHNATGLMQASLAGRWLLFGGVSAMPSMHVAVAVTMALALWARWRPLGALAWAFALVVQVGSVLLGWHYAIDGYAGAALAWGCWYGAGRLTREQTIVRPTNRDDA